MPDFRKLVAPARKQGPHQEEIVSELACHLEEMYVDLCHTGDSEEHALADVSAAGEKLGPTIRKLRWQREGGLRTWLRAVVAPGFILGLVYAVYTTAMGPYWEYPSLWREVGMVLICIALGFCASSLSRELGGAKAQRLWATAGVLSLQAAVECVMICLVTPLELFQSVHHHAPMGAVVSRYLWVSLSDIVTPAAGLIIGGLISVCGFSPSSPNRTEREIA
jgi:hypothetical protein